MQLIDPYLIYPTIGAGRSYKTEFPQPFFAPLNVHDLVLHLWPMHLNPGTIMQTEAKDRVFIGYAKLLRKWGERTF